jgi:hypothetical protein
MSNPGKENMKEKENEVYVEQPQPSSGSSGVLTTSACISQGQPPKVSGLGPPTTEITQRTSQYCANRGCLDHRLPFTTRVKCTLYK